MNKMNVKKQVTIIRSSELGLYSNSVCLVKKQMKINARSLFPILVIFQNLASKIRCFFLYY